MTVSSSRAFAALWVLALPSLRAEEPGRTEASGDPAYLPSMAAGGLLPLTELFASSSGQQMPYYPRRPRLNFDFGVGPFFPIDGKEDFDVGVTMDFKFQGEVVPYLFVGGEFAYTGHGVNDAGRLFFEGFLNRFYLLVPIEVDIPIAGFEENPFSIRFGVAPGIQIVDPYVDHDVEDVAFFNGFEIEEEAFVAFSVRARVGLRFPIGPHFGFMVEGAYDWSEGKGKTRVQDLFSGTEQSFSHYVDLSGVSLFFGVQYLF